MKLRWALWLVLLLSVGVNLGVLFTLRRGPSTVDTPAPTTPAPSAPTVTPGDSPGRVEPAAASKPLEPAAPAPAPRTSEVRTSRTGTATSPRPAPAAPSQPIQSGQPSQPASPTQRVPPAAPPAPALPVQSDAAEGTDGPDASDLSEGPLGEGSPSPSATPRFDRVADALQLRPDQRQPFIDLQRRHFEAVRLRRIELNDARRLLSREFLSGAADEARVRTRLAEVQRVQRALDDELARLLLDAQSILDETQQSRFAELVLQHLRNPPPQLQRPGAGNRRGIPQRRGGGPPRQRP